MSRPKSTHDALAAICLRSIIRFFFTVTTAATLGLPAAGQAQDVFADDFESYADTAGVQAEWNAQRVNSGIQFSTARNRAPIGGTNSVQIARSDDRDAIVLPNGGVTVGNHAKLTFYIFATSAPTGTTGPSRVVAGAGSTSFFSGGVGAGWFNNATAVINGVSDVFSGSVYQGRHPGVAGNLYLNLNNPGTPSRAQGVNTWVKFDVELLSNGQTRYYVDDILGRSVTNVLANNWVYGIIGFGAGTQLGEAWFDGYSIAQNHPEVTGQPTNATINASGHATFTVVANNVESYQWRLNVTNTIAGATNSSLTISNVTLASQGFYSVVASNTNGVIGSAAAQLNIVLPTITSHPTNRTVLEGADSTFALTVSAAPSPTYQWRHQGTNIPGATAASYTRSNALPAHAGNYSVVISNAFGTATSTDAVLTVLPKPTPAIMREVWRISPGTNAWFLTTGSGTARGIAYNALSNHVVVMSRAVSANGLLYVLDADTGALLHSITNPLPSVGTFPQSMVGVAEDGAVYVGNLTTSSSTTDYKIFRYSNTGPSPTITQVFSGNPAPGYTNRWGDTIAVRGSGSGTQVLLVDRSGTNAAIIDPTLGTSTLIRMPELPSANETVLGAAFGSGNTFWFKAQTISRLLRRVSFDLGTGTGTILNSYGNLLSNVTVIAVDPTKNLIFGNAIETPDSLRLYDVSDFGAGPQLKDWEFYRRPSIVGNNSGAIAVDSSRNRVFALDESNGIIGWQFVVPALNIARENNNAIVSWSAALPLFRLQSATTVNGSYTDLPGPVTSGRHTNALDGERYFKLRN